MKHLGDITKINGSEIEPVDCIIGGSPCQDLSVAGKRAGLAGERSGLFMEQIRIVKEMREHDRRIKRADDDFRLRPRYMVWENVPGAFSSHGGKDFQAVITEIVRIVEPEAPDVPLPEKGWPHAGCLYDELGKWSVAWRVHDAQFWGVPQRRRRIALVADFGGLAAPEVLFEREGLSGDSEQSGEAGEETAGAAGGGVEGASKCLNPWDVQSKHIQPPNGVAEALYSGECRYGGGESYVMQGNGASDTISFQERGGKPGGGKGILIQHEHVGALSTLNNQSVLQTSEPILLESNQNHATVQTDGISTALPASMGMGGGYVPMVTAYGISSYDSNAMKSPNPHSGIYEADTARTLDLNGGSPACNQGGIAVVQPSYCLQGNGIGRSDNAGCSGKGWTEEVSYTLNTIDRPAVVQSVGCDVYNQEITGDVAASLTAASGGTNTSGLKVIAYGFEPGAAKRLDTENRFVREKTPTLRADMGDNQTSVLCLNDQGGSVMGVSEDVTGALRAEEHGHQPSVVTYDARGNGDGKTVCTITGDHQNRVTDYTALCVGNGQLNQMSMAEQANTLDTMHDQQAVMVAAVDCRNGTENAVTNGTLQAKENGGQSLNYQNTVRCGAIVRRLTPLECERLQGFPSEKKVDVSKMTKDEYIAWNLAENNIVVDAENGKVYATRGPGGCLYNEPKELKGTELNGYKVVSIRNGATKLQCRVHRVVWISQHGIIPDGYVVDHINNNKLDNRISNLQLLTSAENSHKASDDGLYATGLDNKATKLDPDLKDEVAFLYEYSDMTMRDLAELYGVSKSRIGQIIHEIGWTDIGDWVDSNGKKHKAADSPRYKALGNSIALPFWFYLLRRISAQYERPATLGSLFDGIGGFPLAWEHFNGKGSARWASEIEEFPIAVTKKHFPEE